MVYLYSDFTSVVPIYVKANIKNVCNDYFVDYHIKAVK